MRHQTRLVRSTAIGAVLVLATAACGGDGSVESAESTETAESTDAGAADEGEGGEASSDLPTVVVTTNILGDVVEQVVGDQAEVVTLMPVGADPHSYQASAQQADMVQDADAFIVNGGDFEEGMLGVIDAAEADGVVMFEALEEVETIEFGAGGHDHGGEGEHGGEEHGDEGEHDHGGEHGDEEHGDEGEHEHGDEEHGDEGEHEHGGEEHGGEGEHDGEEGGEHAHDHSGADPHFWTDPERMTTATEALVDFLVDEVDGLDADALGSSAEAYLQELDDLNATITSTLEPLGADRRVLVTNHDVFGYFADRYDFEVVGTVIPSVTTADSADARGLAELAETVRDEQVSAIFADNTTSTDVAESLAAEVGSEVEVIELFTGSLGEDGSGGETYVDMMRTNAERIAEGLGA